MKGVLLWLSVVARLVVVALSVAGGWFAASATACRVLCKKPFIRGIDAFPCGQCLPCRLNRRRLWTHRIVLESRLHEFSSFVTLTYSPECCPTTGDGLAELRPKHTQDWLKRLRAELAPARSVRYYLVGEYGDETFRPHYHAALFGVSSLEQKLLESTWGLGRVHVGELTTESAQYLAGYVTKKMTSSNDQRLGGRYPEFARMSLRPGIGAGAMAGVADALNDTHGARSIAQAGDVPVTLNHGRKSLPLGRYLRRRLRAELGFDQVGGQEAVAARKAQEVRDVSEALGGVEGYFKENPLIDHQRIRQVEGKAKIWSKKGKL